ncbi:MAG: DUF2232 domain-containing protein [Myxococcales bacterium]|nr:DUF2232 domain-containing protein [Myxococcales bacterium]
MADAGDPGRPNAVPAAPKAAPPARETKAPPSPLTLNGALGVVIGATLATVLLMLPVVTAWAAPLPLIYCQARLGLVAGLGVVVASSVALAGIEPGLAWVYVLNFALAGFVIVEALRRRFGFALAMAAAVTAICLGNAANLAVESRAAGRTVGEWVGAEIDRGYQLSRELFSANEGDDAAGEKAAPEPETDAAALAMAKSLVLRTVPAMMVWSAAAVVLANMLLARKLLAKRLRTPLFEYGVLNRWRAPEVLVWGLIGSGGALALHQIVGSEWSALETAALNVLLVLILVYFLQGLAVAAFYLGRANLPPVSGGILRALAYVMIFTSAPLMCVVAGVGVFDMWVDFRRMRPRPARNEPPEQ